MQFVNSKHRSDENMKKSKMKLFLFCAVLIILLIIFMQINRAMNITENSSMTDEKNKTVANFIYTKNQNIKSAVAKKEYENMPTEIEGYKVIGKLQIPSIGLETYILEETNDKTLNISVTKLAGPKINEIGNFCITGHNYINSKMFYKLNKVKVDDSIILTDTYDDSVQYKVYETAKIDPKETQVLTQKTESEREVTLITCTFGAKKRIVVKAIEDYD